MLTAIQQPFFVVVFILLGICMIACLIAAIRGPELGDRIVAANMIGTLTIATSAFFPMHYRKAGCWMWR